MDESDIDLRSDTVTKPTPEMRRAMAEAVVGDDVLGDDPTVHALEQRTAEILGMEAALFVPSGTMANQLAIRCQTEAGDEMLLDAESHIYWYEAGGPAALSGVSCRLLPGVRGVFTPSDVRAARRPADVHFPPTRLLAIENTHNRGGGRVWPLALLRDVCGMAREAGIRTHLDGARLWNAAVAAGISEADYAREFDTVSVCFSKGLGAPVGSALAGRRELIERARRFRKQFGGGLRQAGIIAAGAWHALEHHRSRLAEDHAQARHLAHGLAGIDGIQVAVDAVETNMVYFDVPGRDAREVAARLKENGVLVMATGASTLRAVTSLAVAAAGIERALETIDRVMT
jgi:threonine aldolase